MNQIRERVRRRVGTVTVLLSVLALALVFGAVLGLIPDRVLPRNDALVSAIPHLNVLISIGAIVTIVGGVRAIRQQKIRTHWRLMLASTVLFGTFLVLYLYRVSLEGPTAFEGPDTVRQFVYLPVLAIHILLAIVCLPVVFDALLLAWTHTTAELPSTRHPRVGRIAATLWVVSFVLGITVYALLYGLF